MEGVSSLFIALVLLAGGGATGAIMMSDGVGDWDMMGGQGGMMGGGYEDCPYHDGDGQECYADEGAFPEDCPYHDEAPREEYRGGGCC